MANTDSTTPISASTPEALFNVPAELSERDRSDIVEVCLCRTLAILRTLMERKDRETAEQNTLWAAEGLIIMAQKVLDAADPEYPSPSNRVALS